jgi:catechol 2,3-dioxygenase-like lactoylglutathione lyase family enzyme
MAIQQEKHSLPLKSLNHVSRVCRNVHVTTDFYENVLGFIPIVRPGALKFDGAWLHNYGISVHLLQAENQELSSLPPAEKEINSRDDHLSFQSDSIAGVEQALQEHGIKYTRKTIDEAGVAIEQVFFHDPDGFMIEICTCEVFPVKPLTAATASICNLAPALSAR